MDVRQRAWSIEINDKTIIDTMDMQDPSSVNITSNGVQPRVVFTIEVNALGNETKCDLSIYNLSESTINEAFREGATLGFRCGYTDNIDYIFSGIIRNIFRYRDGADTITQIIARGGKLKKSDINKSFGKNVALSELLQSLADAMGYPLVVNSSEFDKKYTTGYSMTGDPWMILNKLAYAEDFNWAVENEKLVVFTQKNGRNVATQTVSMLTGLEGIPEITEVGVEFTVRLEPSIKIGSRIQLDTTYKAFNFSNVYYDNPLQDVSGSGEYTIMSMRYTGDNYGGAWSKKCQGFLASKVSIS